MARICRNRSGAHLNFWRKTRSSSSRIESEMKRLSSPLVAARKMSKGRPPRAKAEMYTLVSRTIFSTIFSVAVPDDTP